MESQRRGRLTILVKLLLAFAVPTVALFVLFAAVAHEVARRDLEAELGKRLEGVAASTALQIRGKYLVELSPGAEDDRAYLNTLRKLEAAREATGVARIYVFDRDLASRGDTRDGVPIGTEYFHVDLDRAAVERVFDEGVASSAALFTGEDGVLYKAGYAPVRADETDDTVVLAIGVQAPAQFFDRLADLRRSLFVYGAILALVVLTISVIVATLITRPVRQLAAAAERIGKGDLDAPVARTSRDEIGLLADTMEEMRAELRARDEHLQLMLSGIAHEVRNPLGGIELFAGILRDEIPADDPRRAHVDRIGKELGYLKKVVEEFLDYARRPALELGDVDLAGVVEEVGQLEAADAEAAGVALEVDAEPAPCHGDAGQLRRVVLNLVRNAVQASAGVDGGTVHVRSGVEDGGVAVVEVENRGPVIAEDVVAKIFDPFFTTREKGTGLGLALVKEIVEEHGGTIAVASDEEEGTRFWVRIPA